MKCPVCNADIADGSAFCTVCGSPIAQTGNPAVAGQQQYTQPAYGAPQQPDYGQFQQPYGQPQQPYAQPQQPYTQPNYGSMPQYNFGHYKKQFNIGNHLFWIAIFITGLSVFLNFLTISMWGYSESISLFMSDGELHDGVFVLILAVLALIFNACKLNTGNVIASVIELFLMIYEIGNVQSSLKDELGSFADYIKFGPGYYLLIIGTILMLATSILGLILHISAKSKQNR